MNARVEGHVFNVSISFPSSLFPLLKFPSPKIPPRLPLFILVPSLDSSESSSQAAEKTVAIVATFRSSNSKEEGQRDEESSLSNYFEDSERAYLGILLGEYRVEGEHFRRCHGRPAIVRRRRLPSCRIDQRHLFLSLVGVEETSTFPR